jgi:hypothetical protein
MAAYQRNAVSIEEKVISWLAWPSSLGENGESSEMRQNSQPQAVATAHENEIRKLVAHIAAAKWQLGKLGTNQAWQLAAMK